LFGSFPAPFGQGAGSILDELTTIFMRIFVRRADLESDCEALIKLFGQYLTPQFDSSRFEWLYRECPHGMAKAWVACDETTGAIVGAGAAFPRKFYVDGEEKVGLVLGDFCMHERFRSLGPSLQLQRACTMAANEPPYVFFCDFPSHSMMAVYKRMGFLQSQSLIRWARPVCLKSRIESLTGSRLLARGLGPVANKLLSLRGWKGGSGCEVKQHSQSFGEEFTDFHHRLRLEPGVQTACTAEYLNWRYLRPRAMHEILAARQGDTLVGYVVHTRDPKDATVVDLKTSGGPEVVANLLARAVDRLRALGAQTVSLCAADTHPWSATFERAGFRPRERTPIIVCSRPRSGISEANFSRGWLAMRGDRDS